MYESIGFINHTEHRITEAIIIAKKNKPGNWERLPHSWYKISMGTDFWLPKPPAEGEVVYVARNLFYKPQGARQLHKNNDDCWSMLITEGPKEMLGQEITWFNRAPGDAADVPLEVAEDIVNTYNLLGLADGEPELDIFNINGDLLDHPDFNSGMGNIGPANPMAAAAAAGHQQHAHVGQIAQVYQDQGFNGHYDDHGWVTDGQGLNGGAEVSGGFFGLHQINDGHKYSMNQAPMHQAPMGDSVQMPGARGRTASGAQYVQPTAGTDEIFHGNSSPSRKPLKTLGLIAAGVAAIGMLAKGKK